MKNKILVIGVTLAITAVVTFILYYLTLFAINIQNVFFVIILAAIIGIVVGLVLFSLRDILIEKKKKQNIYTYTHTRYDFQKKRTVTEELPIENSYRAQRVIYSSASVGVVSAIILSMCISFIGTPLFNAKKYASQMPITESTVEKFQEEFNFDGELLLPILDKELAFKQAQTRISNYGAQYSIDEENFTILSVHRNGKDELVRIAPLEYSGLFVAINKKEQGSIGYIEVNVVTKESKLVEVKGGMKYMPSGIFDKDLDRHIRFTYPSALYDEHYFEIDDNGNPFWVMPTYSNEITLFEGPNPTGCIIVNPVTGEINRYGVGEEPKWVDRVCVTNLVETQATNALKYKNGFFNAVFGAKKDVFQLSDGYNYFIKNGQTYLISCITSPNEGDETSIGFIAVNLKTKESKKFNINGITEMRAREIAMQHEDVKAQQLEATWPILIDYKGIPTYFLILKNDVQDRKVVFLDVKTGTSIALGSNMEEARLNYEKLIHAGGESDQTSKTIESTVTRTQIFGNDIYFMVEDVKDQYFIVNREVSVDAMFLKVGDKVSVTYYEYDDYNFVKGLTRI